MNLSVQQASFSPTAAVLILPYAKASIQKEDLAVVAQACFFASSLRWFVCGGWPSTGRGVVRTSHIYSTKIKTAKISSEESGLISAKFCTS